MYSPFGKYSGTTAKFGLLAKREIVPQREISKTDPYPFSFGVIWVNEVW